MKKLQKFGALLALLLAVAFAAPTLAQTAPPAAAKSAASKAAAWLVTMQHDDGGYGPAGGNTPSTLGQTDDAIFAFAALGKAAAGISKNGKSLTYFLIGHIAEAKSAGEICKSALAAATSLPIGGQSYGGVNIYDRIDSFYNTSSGMYGSSTIDHAYCLLAQKQLGRAVPSAAVTALSGLQISDGSWAFAGAGKPNDGDTNTTALALQALIANGVDKANPAMSKALAYLKNQQNADGGFPYQNPSQYGTDTDANSTAYVVQALVALGIDPAASSTPFDKGNGATPLAALLKLQVPDGAFIFQASTPSDNVLATLQAIPALEYITQPPPPVRSDPGQTYPTPDITSQPAIVSTPPPAIAATPTTAPPTSGGNSGLPKTGAGDFSWLLFASLFAAIALAGGLLLRRGHAR
jgi:LPXTG-motif cell wall-anchored protein